MFAYRQKDYLLLPGRLRITIPGLRKNALLAQYLVRHCTKVSGISLITASTLTGRALIYYDQNKISFPALCSELEQRREHFWHQQVKRKTAGKAGLPGTAAIRSNTNGRKLLYVLATSGVLAGLIAKRLFKGRSALASSSIVFYLTALTTILGSYPLLRRGVDALAHKKKINADLLLFFVTLALLAMRESITGLSILGIVYLSDLFHHKMQIRSQQSIKRLLAAKEQKTVRLEDGKPVKIPVQNLNMGDLVVLNQGQQVPVDGEIVAGKAIVDQAAVSGESNLVTVGMGDNLYAGMRIQSGMLTVRASRVGTDTSLFRMAKMVEQAAALRGPSAQAEDGYAQKLMPWTTGIAAIIFLVTRDFYRALAVVLAGCPIAVSIAENTALGTAVAEAADNGIYVKKSSCLKAAGQTEVVLWDKTGTLTTGSPVITEVAALTSEIVSQDVLLLAASAEQSDNHPLARMIVAKARQHGLGLRRANSEILVGYGVKASINQQEVLVGNASLMHKEQIEVGQGAARTLRLKHLGNSIIYVAVDKKLIGLIGVREQMRPESSLAIKQLRAAGINRIGLITGDTAGSGDAVARELGINKFWSSMKPEDKIGAIHKLRKCYKVMMVGDGINDSPAMAAADIGVAMADGCPEIALRAADVAIAGDDPRKVSRVISIGRRTNRVISQNLSLAVGTNVVGIALAAANLISPFAATLLLNLNTIGVIANSTRLLAGRSGKRTQVY